MHLSFTTPPVAFDTNVQTTPHVTSWPDPSAVSMSVSTTIIKPSARVLLGTGQPRSVTSTKLTTFEVRLVDHLADYLLGKNGQHIRSIQEATGVTKAEVQGPMGNRVFCCQGSSSTVAKARQLIDAKLSHVPLKLFLSIRSKNTLEMSCFALTPYQSVDLLPKPPTKVWQAVYADFTPETCQGAASDSVTRLNLPLENQPLGTAQAEGIPSHMQTPSSERSFSFTPFNQAISETILGDTRSSQFPNIKIGSYDAERDKYVEVLVDELERAVNRNSLVKLEAGIGNQVFGMVDESQADLTPIAGSDIERKWRISGHHKNVVPHFESSVSRSTGDVFKHIMTQRGMNQTRMPSQIHIVNLDRRRGVYAKATSDLKGGDIQDVEEGTGISGTLSLKKCSTLPSNPFSLSIINPLEKNEAKRAGVEPRDIRIKVIADKAATSPSQELSLAFQQANWVVDECGHFQVKIDLEPKRFSPEETVIQWSCKTRYDNDNYRVSVTEFRAHGTRDRWWEVEFTNKKLSATLEDFVQKRKPVNRELVTGMANEFIDWGVQLLDVVHDELKKPIEERPLPPPVWRSRRLERRLSPMEMELVGEESQESSCEN